MTIPTSGTGGGPGDVEIFLGNGDGTLQSPIAYPLDNLGSSHPSGVAVADFNRDGKLDLIVSDSVNAVATCWGMVTARSRLQPQLPPPEVRWRPLI